VFFLIAGLLASTGKTQQQQQQQQQPQQPTCVSDGLMQSPLEPQSNPTQPESQENALRAFLDRMDVEAEHRALRLIRPDEIIMGLGTKVRWGLEVGGGRKGLIKSPHINAHPTHPTNRHTQTGRDSAADPLGAWTTDQAGNEVRRTAACICLDVFA
jgi:hypothetical protein